MVCSIDYSGQNILVTGGSNGIGLAIAKAFLDAGASVSVTGTKESADQYPCNLSAFHYHQAIMEDTASVDALIAAVGPVDVLVNNAGTFVDPPEGLSPEGFDRNMVINLNSVYRLSRGLHPRLAKRPGCIINIASMYSYFGSGSGPAYSASKTGIVGLTKSLAVAYARDGIRVNAIAPGWVRTNLTEGTQANEASSGPIVKRTPLARWGEPEEMAGTILFLASSVLAGFVTGVTIPVDGGYSAM
jgi:NAD(P)-dependent dehydrogenase (short-subunit alcohol dehydrogenase family)